MDPDTFDRLIAHLMDQAPTLTEAEAEDFAVAIGDTPESTPDGQWTVTVNGRTLVIEPMEG